MHRVVRLLGTVSLFLFALSAPNTHAISSCQVVAGNSVGAGNSANCTLGGPTELSAGFSDSFTSAAASLKFAYGSMSGSATRMDAIGGARFGAEIIQDVRITGPSTSVPLLATFGFSVGASIAKDCLFCEGDLGGRFKIENVSGPTLLLEASAATSTGSPDWTYNKTAFGLGATASDLVDIDSTHVGGSLIFDAGSQLGHTLRVTVSISGNAQLTNIGAGPNAITVDGSNTALFNFFLPAGYTLTAIGAPGAGSFLTDPILLAPVPLPATI